MNKIERAKMVLAMEYIARQINDENVLEGWLMCGVADGDFDYGEWDTEVVNEWYLEDKNFRDLMSCFLRRMFGTYKSGGLYCDNIASDHKENNV